MRAVRRALAWALVGGSASVLGCAPGAPAPPPGLAYRLPVPPPAGYRLADTVRVELQAMGQSFALEGAARSEWATAFAPDPGGVRVTATLTDLSASMSNPLGGGGTADESGVEGPLVLVLGPRGETNIQLVPLVTPEVAQFFTGESIAERLFPALPGRSPAVGESWVDTVSTGGREGEVANRMLTAWRFTLVGDTVVEGATLRLVRGSASHQRTSDGTMAGVEFSQDLSGTIDGFFLWDERGASLRSSEYRSDLTGTMTVSLSPVPFTVGLRSVVRVERMP
jgi:hypothetical protein